MRPPGQTAGRKSSMTDKRSDCLEHQLVVRRRRTCSEAVGLSQPHSPSDIGSAVLSPSLSPDGCLPRTVDSEGPCTIAPLRLLSDAALPRCGLQFYSAAPSWLASRSSR